MPIYRGTRKIGSLYRGTRKIIKVYRGSRLIYQSRTGSGIEIIQDIYLNPNAQPPTTNLTLGSRNVSTATDKFEIDVMLATTNNISLMTGSIRIRIAITNGVYEYRYGGTNIATTQIPSLNTKQTLALDIGGFYVDGTLISSTTTSLTETNRSLSVNFNKQVSNKCYGVRYYKNNVLVHNFVPAYNWDTHVFGCYDTIEEVFYFNPFLKGDFFPIE